MLKGETKLIELSFFNTKKSAVKYIPIILVYMMVILSLLMFLSPKISELKLLENTIKHEQSQVEMIERLIEQRHAIEAELDTLTAAALMYEEMIPRAVDLPGVLAAVKEVAAVSQAELVKLDYDPLRAEGANSMYRLNMELAGGCGNVLAAVQSLGEAFPSLYYTDMSLISSINGSVHLRAGLDLYVIPAQRETSASWQPPVWQETGVVPSHPFGTPLWYLQESCVKGIKLLGVVKVHGSEYRALVSVDGAQVWTRVGEPLGVGTVSEISETMLVLDVNGVKIGIDFGGEL